MRYLAISFLAALGWATPADAAVAVTFVHPETYTDAGLYRAYSPRSREPAMEGIRRYLEGLGERALAPDQRLSIEVLDIDLAGRFESWRPAAYDVRFMTSITWPRIKLRYTLEHNGRVVDRAEESVQDMNYLAQAPYYGPTDPLRYEKAMLLNWFKARFVRRDVPGD